MTVKGCILLGLPELIGIDDVDRVLLTVDRSLLKSRQRIVPVHRNRIRSKRLKCSCVDVIFHDTDLQTLDIICRMNGLLAVGQVAESSLCIGKALQIGAFQRVEQLAANLAVKDCICLRVVREQEWHIQNTHILGEIDERAGSDDAHVQRIHLHGLQHVSLSAEVSVRMDLDCVLPVGLVLNKLCELDSCDLERVILIDRRPKLQDSCTLRDLRLYIGGILDILSTESAIPRDVLGSFSCSVCLCCCLC